MSTSKTSKRAARFSRYNLFTEEFFKRHDEKQKMKGMGKKSKDSKKTYQDLGVELRAVWKGLSAVEKVEYKRRAQLLRGPAKAQVDKYTAPFLTRCAPNTFMQVAEQLKDKPEAMARLQRIGFDRLLEISCRKINRSLCAQYMKCFDPPTKEVCIRGETRALRAEDVHQLIGLPLGGREIKVTMSDQNPILVDFRTVYKKVNYKIIGDMLLGTIDDKFEFLFVLFTLSTLLAPSASVYVSGRMLRLMTVTKDALGQFDWCSFILHELVEEIAEFKENSHKSKGKKSKTVGGCVYFLMLFCLQNFPLSDAIAPTPNSAMAYWTDDIVKSRLVLEKQSQKGLLVGHSRSHRPGTDSQPSVSTSESFDPKTMLTHLEVRKTYYRLVSMVGQEMLALQERLTSGSNKNEGPRQGANKDDDEDDESPHNHPTTFEDSEQHNDKDKDGSEEDDDKEKSKDSEAEDIQDTDNDDHHQHSSAIVEAPLDIEPILIDLVESQVAKIEAQEGDGRDVQIRRSKRAITRSSVLKSPWIDPNRKSKGKRHYDEKDQLYELCTRTSAVTTEELNEDFIDMHGFYMKRRELACLKPRAWINDTLMSMVSRTLVADQRNDEGVVTRHIFSAHFMHKIIRSPRTWSVEDNAAEILPELIGYNIGDCRFIFGSSLWLNHWFCYALDTTTMTFFALDSLVENHTYMRIQRELKEGKKVETKSKKKANKPASFDAKGKMANEVRKCFMDILRRVKSQLFENEGKIPKGVTWAKVHVQSDVDSCGVHVLSWLQSWDGIEKEDGYTMPSYQMDDLREIKIDMLWWLVNHPNNLHRANVLSLIQEAQARKMSR